MKHTKRRAFRPATFLTTCRPAWFPAGMQQDAAEFLVHFLDQVQRCELTHGLELKKSKVAVVARADSGACGRLQCIFGRVCDLRDSLPSRVRGHTRPSDTPHVDGMWLLGEAGSSAAAVPLHADDRQWIPSAAFQGEMRTVSRCAKCGQASRRLDSFNVVTLALAEDCVAGTSKHDTLERMLTSYLTPEVPSIYCESPRVRPNATDYISDMHGLTCMR